MSRFGWDLPPGCSISDIHRQVETGPCAICGRDVDAGDCICPECPVCEETGNPTCLGLCGLRLTPEQIAASWCAAIEAQMAADVPDPYEPDASEWAIEDEEKAAGGGEGGAGR